ncbi:hypothetical protein MRX96_010375 [Rhipicephalus microplus]
MGAASSADALRRWHSAPQSTCAVNRHPRMSPGNLQSPAPSLNSSLYRRRLAAGHLRVASQRRARRGVSATVSGGATEEELSPRPLGDKDIFARRASAEGLRDAGHSCSGGMNALCLATLRPDLSTSLGPPFA